MVSFYEPLSLPLKLRVPTSIFLSVYLSLPILLSYSLSPFSKIDFSQSSYYTKLSPSFYPYFKLHVDFISSSLLFSIILTLHPSIERSYKLSIPAGIWHISGLIHSLNENRRRIGDKLINATHRTLTEKGKKEDAQMIVDSQKLFPELIDLAALQLKERKLKWRMTVRMDLKRFLVPTQVALRARTSFTGSGSRNGEPSQLRDFRTQSTGGNGSAGTGRSGVALKADTGHYGADPNEVPNVILLHIYTTMPNYSHLISDAYFEIPRDGRCCQQQGQA